MHSLARNTYPPKSSKPSYFTHPHPKHSKSNIFFHFARNRQAPFICSLNTNFSKYQNQLDGCPTFEESHYKCIQYIAVYNCQNMLKSLSLIRSMFSSGKRRLLDGSALSKRVRNIPTINCGKMEQYCIAKAIHQKGKQAKIISILKKESLPVSKICLVYLNVNPPSPLPELLAINQSLQMAKENNMRDFIVYFPNGTIMNMSRLNIRDRVLLAMIQQIDQLSNEIGAILVHSPDFVNNDPVIQEEMNKKGGRL